MTPGALRSLVLHRDDRWTHLLVGLGAVALLSATGRMQAEKQLLLATIVGAAIGGRVGALIGIAEQTTFAWTVPGFRQSMRTGFLVCGVLVAVAEFLAVTAAGAGSGPAVPPILAGLGGFFGFAVGSATFVFPLLFVVLGPLGIAVFYVDGPMILTAMLAHSRLAGVLLLAGAALSTALTFSRWVQKINAGLARPSSLRDRPQHAPPMARLVRSSFGMAPPRLAGGRPITGASTFRATMVVSAVESSWAGPLLFIAAAGGFGLVQRALPPGVVVIPALIMPLVMSSLRNGGWLGEARLRLPLPWSRHQQARVAYLLHLRGLGANVALPALAMTVGFAAWSPHRLGDLGRVAAVCAMFLPSLGWIGVRRISPSRWQQASKWIAPVAATAGFTIALDLALVTLPRVDASGATEAAVLLSLVAAAWLAHWYALSRSFAVRDLVSNEERMR